MINRGVVRVINPRAERFRRTNRLTEIVSQRKRSNCDTTPKITSSAAATL